MTPLVEVRVPTYRRPVLLRRALDSLLSQTHTNWRAIVLDDSPGREAEHVCDVLADARIAYAPNAANLGICDNLNSAFTRPPIVGAAFLCVLEDDNYYLPDHFEDSIASLTRSGCDVMLRDHLIERSHDRHNAGTLDGSTQYVGQYPDGVIDNLRLFAAFFYSIGATNCGLFWRVGAGLDFSTTQFVDEVVWQERLRTLCIDRPVYIAMRPTVVWRDNGDASWRVVPMGLGWYQNAARWAAFEREIYAELYDFLKRSKLEDQIWKPPLGDFGIHRERVFHRVGIAVPPHLRRLGRKERIMLGLKREAARLLSKTTPYRCSIAFDSARSRLMPPAVRV